MKKELFILALGLIFSANFAYAQVEITEIMYDLDGTDSGREWIEIKNESGGSVDFSEKAGRYFRWRISKNSGDHQIIPEEGGSILAPGEFAIVALDPIEFLNDWPGFFGIFFKSSFKSLNNIGEAIAIKDSLNEILTDELTYSSEWGANDDGNSLQKINGEWLAGLPTPGEENFADGGSATSEEEQQSGDLEESSSASQSSDPGNWEENIPTKFAVFAGDDKTVLAGAVASFEANAKYPDGTEESKAQFFWSFGDGATASGKKVVHTFLYPGVYSVHLSATIGDYSASDSLVVSAVPSPLEISRVEPGKYIEVFNNSARKIEISNFGLRLGLNKFYFPANTFISPRAKIPVSEAVLGFAVLPTGVVEILYPSGEVLLSYSYPEAPAPKIIASAPSVKAQETPKPAITPNQAEAEKPAQAPPAEKLTASVSDTKALNPSPSTLLDEYFWLVMGLAAGAVVGLAFVLLKRFLRYN